MVWAVGDAVGEGGAGDAPGGFVGEGGVGGAGGVGAAGGCVVAVVALVARVVLLMVLGVCPRLLWPGLGGLLVHRLGRLWFPLVAEVAGRTLIVG